MPFPHPSSPLTSLRGITYQLQTEKHAQLVKVWLPPCPIIDPQELGGPLPAGALMGEESSESGFGARILPKDKSWGPTVWKQFSLSVSCLGSQPDL